MVDEGYRASVVWLNQHPAIAGLVLLLLAALASVIVDLVFKRIIKRITDMSKTDLDGRIAKRIHRPFQATVFLMVAVWALREIYDDHPAVRHIFDFAFSIILIWWIWTMIQAVRLVFGHLKDRYRSDSGWVHVLPLLNNVVTIVLVILGGFWLLDLWQVNVTPLLASAGILTAAVALAAKDTLANFFGGVSIFLDRPYRVRDYVVLETGERGEVVDIGMRSTRIQTRGDVLVTIPNATMANAKVINETEPAQRFRVDCKVGVSYDSDPDQVEKILLSCTKDIPEILQFPNPRVRFRAFGDSSLEFVLLAWVKDPRDQGRIVHNMNRSVFYAFKEAGIEIPFPQRVLHITGGEIPVKPEHTK